MVVASEVVIAFIVVYTGVLVSTVGAAVVIFRVVVGALKVFSFVVDSVEEASVICNVVFSGFKEEFSGSIDVTAKSVDCSGELVTFEVILMVSVSGWCWDGSDAEAVAIGVVVAVKSSIIKLVEASEPLTSGESSSTLADELSFSESVHINN